MIWLLLAVLFFGFNLVVTLAAGFRISRGQRRGATNV